MQQIQVVDSHTGGEPTRIIIKGGPDLGEGPLDIRRQIFAERFDHIRQAVVAEPRGSDVLIGGLLCEPVDPACAAGVIFFDTAGFLGMCGHGTIGFVITLQHLGRIGFGQHKIETPVGQVTVELAADNQVTVQNIASYRYAADVTVEVPEYGEVVGDIAWGGNWFFLVKGSKESLDPRQTDHLLRVTKQIREALKAQDIRGPAGELIDHIELYGPAVNSDNDSKNFVLCPGGEYDRSPCGTGTSAKLACLAANGSLSPGQIWRQESIIGSVFECRYEVGENETILPTLQGQAHISSEANLILDPNDPFCMGIPR